MSANLELSTENVRLALCRARGFGLTKEQALDILKKTFGPSQVQSAKYSAPKHTHRVTEPTYCEVVDADGSKLK